MFEKAQTTILELRAEIVVYDMDALWCPVN